MEKWMGWIAYGILFFSFAFVPTKKALHMFQQNRYELKRYTMWLIDRLHRLSRVDIMGVGGSIFLLAMGINKSWVASVMIIGLLVGWTLIVFQKESQKDYIKPLVYTARVKRQTVVMVLLYCILLIMLSFFKPYPLGLIAILGLLKPWAFIYIMHFITLPIEKIIKKKYADEAKLILKNHGQLTKIGITGSYGKTSSKNVLYSLLSEKYHTLMTPASYNTPMGITRTIREHLQPIHEVFICEMGADHTGDIQELCNFVMPTIGLVTSIGPQHLNTFGSIENIIYEKMQLIEKLPETGLGIINLDNEYIRDYQIKNSCRLIRYGIHNQQGDYRVEAIEYSPKGSKFDVVFQAESHHFETKLLGEHNIANIIAAIAIAQELGMSWDEMILAVKQLDFVEHRLQLKKINGYTFIDNAFNSNPVGAAMSLEVLKTMPGKRVIVTPGMIDLGDQQDLKNKEFGERMQGCVDIAILVGEKQTQSIKEGLIATGFDLNEIHVCKTVKEAFDLVYRLATSEDTILLENDLPDAFNH